MYHQPSKTRKIIKIRQEFVVTDSLNYNINGIEDKNIKFYYKEKKGGFYEIPFSDYTIEYIDSNKNIVFLGLDKLQDKTKIQVGTEIFNSSQKYVPEQKIDVQIFLESYNNLVDNFDKLYDYVSNTLMISDTLDTEMVLPELMENEIWVKTESGFKAWSLIEVEKHIMDMIQEQKDYLTNWAELLKDDVEVFVDDSLADYNNNAEEKLDIYNDNHNSKMKTYNDNATVKTNEYNSNAIAKTKNYDDNHDTKLKIYNDNATLKTNQYNANAVDKTTIFNNNSTEKINEYDTNHDTKFKAYNDNTVEKTTEYNANSTEKINEYDTNHDTKFNEYLETAKLKIEEIKTTQGMRGEKGEKGEKGDKGEGLDYSTMTPEEIANITGKSAYDVWIENGNVGTEQEFLESLKGEDYDPIVLETKQDKTDNSIKTNSKAVVGAINENFDNIVKTISNENERANSNIFIVNRLSDELQEDVDVTGFTGIYAFKDLICSYENGLLKTELSEVISEYSYVMLIEDNKFYMQENALWKEVPSSSIKVNETALKSATFKTNGIEKNEEIKLVERNQGYTPSVGKRTTSSVVGNISWTVVMNGSKIAKLSDASMYNEMSTIFGVNNVDGTDYPQVRIAGNTSATDYRIQLDNSNGSTYPFSHTNLALVYNSSKGTLTTYIGDTTNPQVISNLGDTLKANSFYLGSDWVQTNYTGVSAYAIYEKELTTEEIELEFLKLNPTSEKNIKTLVAEYDNGTKINYVVGENLEPIYKELNKQSLLFEAFTKVVESDRISNEAKFQGKLDKGTYAGTAQDLKNDIDTKTTESKVRELIATLVDSAPETLDTLNELARALGDDPNFATTVTTALGNKLDKGTYTGTAKDLENLAKTTATTGRQGIVQLDTTTNSTSTTRAATPSAVKLAYDLANSKLDKGNLPNTIQTAEKILELIENNSGLEFDESLLYIQDSGTKQENKYYFDKLQKGLFRCLSNTTSTVNSATYFENESNRNNADKLENFSKIKKLFGTPTKNTQITLSESVSNYKFIVVGLSVPWGYPESPASFMVPTEELLKYGCTLYGGSDGKSEYKIKITASSRTLTRTGGISSRSDTIYYVYGINAV